MTFDELFEPEPLRWGRRGDPHLWAAMRERFAGQPLPENQFALADAVRTAFEELTGARLDGRTDHIGVAAYRVGSGMSDGMVSGKWWFEVGRALIADRWNVARHRLEL
ncbi:hypothetical protein [Actinoplanes sp. NPDC023714]|uniref:hypothetical protein n=1 Tax=Actinoplanes sp. NPDC023714 TaxID=3154322 RepID=UPI0033F1F6CA